MARKKLLILIKQLRREKCVSVFSYKFTAKIFNDRVSIHPSSSLPFY